MGESLPHRHSPIEGVMMKTLHRSTVTALTFAGALALGACSSMSERDKATAIGAGVGAVGGAALTSGSALGTIGGAAVGGVIGNQVGKDKK
jgi:osmotically inducible lipoprotein OsmB